MGETIVLQIGAQKTGCTSLQQLLRDQRDGLLAEAAGLLRSYRAQLEATGFPPSADPASFAYLEEGSWLVAHDALLGPDRRGLAVEHVEVLGYDDAVRRDGSVIRAFTDPLIARSSLPDLDLVEQTR